VSEDAASAITDALSESARHLWFAVMLARYGEYANAQEMQATAREVSDTIAATIKLPTVADLIYADLSDIVDALVLDYASTRTKRIH
jgi:hypothetical protein